MTPIEIPCIALDYLTQGDPSGLTVEQILRADAWSEDWEITEVESLADCPSYELLAVPESYSEDREYDEDYRHIA